VPANNMMIRFFLTLLLVIQSAHLAGAEELKCDPSQDINFEQQFAVAEQLRKQAAAEGAEWLATEGLLIRSREEAGSGNWSPALELVQRACLQAETALQQAQHESEAWKSRVIK
jgi:hypothetical protein